MLGHNRADAPRRIRPDRALLHTPGAARRAGGGRRLRVAGAGAGHAAGACPATCWSRAGTSCRPCRRSALGHKALAVNLSDLAACGAEPLAFTLAWRCRAPTRPFLPGFAEGLWALADAHGIELVGGDTTAGPLNICITVFGEVPRRPGAAARRRARAATSCGSAATLGDARARARGAFAARWRCRATPSIGCGARWSGRSPASRWAWRCAASPAARSTSATACCGDLGHVLARSGVGAARRRRCAAAQRAAGRAAAGGAAASACWRGGDDYELLFSAPRRRAAMRCARRRATPAWP